MRFTSYLDFFIIKRHFQESLKFISYIFLSLHQIENSQHRITMILKSLGIAIELCDISAPGMEVGCVEYSFNIFTKYFSSIFEAHFLSFKQSID